ncbi:hypothetical protein BJP36_41105 [Moorena producens JHB]|uniref:Uncharacterized protein n=1 Tax=Moorena producens (strain JHB) TaxID=1454205 RepID=A0A9Q9UVF0_MOOP1|nr:hypothetical protein [Moorena producens]WAN68765.1 hypothetical protein BJP36_41105 [Moorena producens JHB]
MPTKQGTNGRFLNQCPPYDYCGLVGIAHVIARRSIMMLISNAHPTILPIPDKNHYY